MPSLALVIVNYNTRELLTGCLDSVFASRCRYPFRVILVDNNSTDGSAELVRTHYPQVTLLESARKGGSGYANNIALRALAVPPCPAPVQQQAMAVPAKPVAGFGAGPPAPNAPTLPSAPWRMPLTTTFRM